MSEIFDIIIAVNRLKDQVETLNSRIDKICKDPGLIAFNKYVNERTAAKLLDISQAELRKMRSKGEIAFIRHHRKVLYHVDAINHYLTDNLVPQVKRV
jgi:hypothetical protein